MYTFPLLQNDSSPSLLPFQKVCPQLICLETVTQKNKANCVVKQFKKLRRMAIQLYNIYVFSASIISTNTSIVDTSTAPGCRSCGQRVTLILRNLSIFMQSRDNFSMYSAQKRKIFLAFGTSKSKKKHQPIDIFSIQPYLLHTSTQYLRGGDSETGVYE